MNLNKSQLFKLRAIKRLVKHSSFLLFFIAIFSFSQGYSNYPSSSKWNNSIKNIPQDSLRFNSLDCSNAIPLTLNQTYFGNTAEGNSNVSVYNNDPFWRCTGKENVHSIDWPGGLMIVRLTNKSTNLDPIVLGNCDPSDYKCGKANSKMEDISLDRYLPSGSYYIVVEGWERAEGSYQLTVMKPVAIINNDIYYIKGTTLFKISTPSDIEIEKNVVYAKKAFGYIVPGSNPLEGKEEDALYILKKGEQKARLFYKGNFESIYHKQHLSCGDVKLDLMGTDVFKGNDKILENCDVLRCENGHTLSHQLDGTIKLYRPKNTQDSWLDIKQIITVNEVTYYVKNDLTIWAINGDVSEVSQIGTKAHLLQDNDNQLIHIDKNNKYFRWTGNDWLSVDAKYISVSPQIIEEGFWSFIQPKSTLDKTNSSGKNLPDIEYRKGLYFNADNNLEIVTIPENGDCDAFLWRTKKLSNGRRLLINKAKGENSPLIINEGENITSEKNDGETSWAFTETDRAKYGTTAFRITNKTGKALTFSNNAVQLVNSDDNDLEQVWLFQFNQMVRDYFIPQPNNENLDKFFLDDLNKKVFKFAKGIIPATNSDKKVLKKVLTAAYPKIQASYNKFLKADYGVNCFATNTSSDWALVNYYFVINNIMNAVNKPNPSYGGLEINNLSYMASRNLILINKNDLSANIPKQYFSKSMKPHFLAKYRGGTSYTQPFIHAIITSEELSCKKGIVNRPLDTVFRKFNHGVHEFTHALSGMCNWSDIIRKVYTEANDSEKESICWDFGSNLYNKSPECICWMIQIWFNSIRSDYYPQSRTDNEFQKQIMEVIFNKENTWMPPKAFRKNGYSPSKSAANEVDGKH